MKKIDCKNLPREFVSEYRKNITIRCLCSVVLMLACVYLCTVIDFSKIKYPIMGILMILVCGFVLASLFFGLHRILFKPSWMGEIISIEAAYKTKIKNRGLQNQMTVTVFVDRGNAKPYASEIFCADKQNSNKNLYQVYAPYKVGDTVVYLRGMKYFARFGIENASELLDTLFVCPYCGEINKNEREHCYACGKILLK